MNNQIIEALNITFKLYGLEEQYELKLIGDELWLYCTDDMSVPIGILNLIAKAIRDESKDQLLGHIYIQPHFNANAYSFKMCKTIISKK